VDSESAWLAGHLLARAIARHGNADVEGVRNAVLQDELDSPAGRIRLDADNNHCWLTPHLARCHNGRLESFWQADAAVKPDPWLAWVDLASLTHRGGHE
jgi:branched-chain amino acid transport system substrate-binding protein